jgi:hypothetical protein
MSTTPTPLAGKSGFLSVVIKMDCTDPVGVQRTFDQGLMEAAELLERA